MQKSTKVGTLSHTLSAFTPALKERPRRFSPKMAEIVREFNALNRPERTLGGGPNHWYFAIRHWPFQPVGDVVQLIQPSSQWATTIGPEDILALSNIDSQADLVVRMLLTLFVNGLARHIPRFAPRSWATRNHSLARAIETKLRALGVREELCTVHPGDDEQSKAADINLEMRINCYLVANELSLPEVPTPGRKICSRCWRDSSWFSSDLLHCKGCSGATRYCSTRCQKKDRKKHRTTCGKNCEGSGNQAPEGSTSTNSPALDPLDYYQKVAHTSPEAKALADSIDLPLPPSSTDLCIPIRRLVFTGKDTPENFQLLLGPKWKTESEFWAYARMEILIKPAFGSASWTNLYKDGSGKHPKSPRAPSAEEWINIQIVRDIQQQLRHRLGSRDDPTDGDMEAVFASYEGDQKAMLPLYRVAVNSMVLSSKRLNVWLEEVGMLGQGGMSVIQMLAVMGIW